MENSFAFINLILTNIMKFKLNTMHINKRVYYTKVLFSLLSMKIINFYNVVVCHIISCKKGKYNWCYIKPFLFIKLHFHLFYQQLSYIYFLSFLAHFFIGTHIEYKRFLNVHLVHLIFSKAATIEYKRFFKCSSNSSLTTWFSTFPSKKDKAQYQHVM